MILYLCTNQNINLFDFLDKEQGMPIKKLAGNFKLKQFVIHDVRNLSQFSYFIIDIKALKDSEDDIVEAITAFGTMYSSRIIIFAEGLDGNSSLIPRLIEINQHNIITSTEFEDIKEEMIECISPAGKNVRSLIINKYFSQEDIKSKKKVKYSFLCRDIKIAVVGAAHKVGTSTTAFNLVNFLVNAGAEAAYVEANENEHLRCLPSFYKEMTVKENCTLHHGAKYYFKGNFPEENNFIVIDFGTIEKCSMQALKQCEVLILCGTAKPYEIDFVKDALKKLEESHLELVLSHVSKDEQKDIKAIFESKNSSLYFSEYSPDLFDGKANEYIFTALLKEYIQVEAGE